MRSTQKFEDSLLKLPAAGMGNGFHTALLGTVNHGVFAGLDDFAIFTHVHAAIKPGKRPVSDREIWDAIKKARHDCFPNKANSPLSTPHSEISLNRTSPTMPPDAFERVTSSIDLGPDPEAEAWERSSFRLEVRPEDETAEVLSRLYRPDDLLLCGDPYVKGEPGDGSLLACAEWVWKFKSGERPPEHLCINPLSGKQGHKKTGELSYRCDDTVARFPYVLVEFDSKPVDEQIRFFLASGLPIASLTHSGSKSCHALVRVNAPDRSAWGTAVARLYFLLEPLGADASNKNPSRFTRLPGGWRPGKQAWQRVIYLEAQHA